MIMHRNPAKPGLLIFFRTIRKPYTNTAITATAAINLIHNSQQKGEELDIPSLCASFSLAVSDMLVPRTIQALEMTGYGKLSSPVFLPVLCNGPG